MKRVGILLGMGLLLCGSAVWAEEKPAAPEPLKIAPVPAAPAAAPGCGASGCAPGCAAGCEQPDHWNQFCDWLMYHPPHTHCACQCVVSHCTPPAYLWFTDMCVANCGGRCGNAHTRDWHLLSHDDKAACAEKDTYRPKTLMEWFGFSD